MTNNDILRRVRYIFDFSDAKTVEIFGMANLNLTRSKVGNLLRKEDDPAFEECNDTLLAIFLNGLITAKRGKKDGTMPVPEKELTNNIIFRKLAIALNLQADDILKILDLVDINISRHELSAFFRKAGHRHYRECQDQVLRNFIKGLQLKYRPAKQ